jgi:micrococcal nuclease
MWYLHLGLQTQRCVFKNFSRDKMILRWCILGIAVGIAIANNAYADDEMNGHVTAVLDGNTIEISFSNNDVRKVLFAGIDSPELGQEFGHEARKFLEKIVLRKNVTVEFKGKDRFGNHLAIVKIKGRVDARIEVLKNGFAWTSEQDPNDELERYRITAQQSKSGLWKQENPIPPWTYRRQQTMLAPKPSS